MRVLCLLIVVFLGAGCFRRVLYDNAAEKAGDVELAKNFERIRYILNYSLDNGDTFPETLTELGAKSIQWGIPFSKEIFLCPGSGNQAGALTNIDEWTDFIYIGGISAGIYHSAQVISPPENHGGRFGYVFW